MDQDISKVHLVLIAVRDFWSNYPSIYNPHEAPILVSIMLLKELYTDLNYIQFVPNQMNKPGPYRTLQTGPAYSSGLAQTVYLHDTPYCLL